MMGSSGWRKRACTVTEVIDEWEQGKGPGEQDCAGDALFEGECEAEQEMPGRGSCS